MRVLAFASLLLSAAIPSFGQDSIDYVRQIKPVLQARCYACHGVLKQEAGLRLDTAALAIKGGDSGAAIKLDAPDASLLLERISATDDATRMPPEGEPLKPAEIAAFKAWVLNGAKAPADEKPERDPRDHWAFRAPIRPSVPRPSNPDWVRNPIDAFIVAELQRRGITPQRPANRLLWLRRVSLDLIGLPPSEAEIEAYLSDISNEANDRVISRLLDSPQYGERWGRHWMDIWRYSDWWGLGAEVRNSQKHIWHWRDWIIESLNSDKGYDQMLREMIAADELYPNDLDKLRASGFLARQYFKFNRTSWLDETVEHTSKAMLGLTFNCAKCHDHKYDPFAQREYYQMRAIFEPYQVRTDALPGEIDFEHDGVPRAFDGHLDAQTFLHIRGDDRNPDKSITIEPAIPAFLKFGEWHVASIQLPPEAIQPALRPFVEQAYLKQAEQRIAEARMAIESARRILNDAIEADRIASALRESPADALSAIPRQIVADDFAVSRPDTWEIREGTWIYADGRLKQSQAGATRAALRLNQLPPADFEARLKFITTGGETWKSVGIALDVTAQNEVLAYLSAYAGGSKSQIAYKQVGNYVYPAEAAQPRTVGLNQPHEMILRVRGNLMNVSVDGQHSLAYHLPIQRKCGELEIITFDASAEFLAFELYVLAPAAALEEPASSAKGRTDKSLSVDQARVALALAERVLTSAELQPNSIRSRLQADRVRFHNPDSIEVAKAVVEAVRAERMASAAKSNEDVSRAELEWLNVPADKKPEAEKKLVAARAALEAADKLIDTPGETYTPVAGSLKTLESNLESEESRRKPFPKTSTGRRTAFANWLTDTRNPLVARVSVNHIWARHFGRPLVPTVFDFGRKGTPPTHPELLDWLAIELQESGWSMKHLHRLIVSSNTYRLGSSTAGAIPETIAADPDNTYYWHANPLRMEAQLIRDSLLQLAGELDLTRGGPPISVGNDSRRRSLYYVHSHNEHQKFLSMFDDASVLECYRRAQSIVPQQALALENSPLATAAAEKITQRIAAAHPNLSDREFIEAAFTIVLASKPTTDEAVVVLEAIEHLRKPQSEPGRPTSESAIRVSIVHVLLNHNDFVTIR
jgi:mono/diheme cytochrome c family protein